MASKTQMTTGKVRFSYLNVFEPKEQQSGDLKYSVTLLIPKNDKKTLAKIQAAKAEAINAYNAKTGKNASNLNSTMHDGDGQKENGEYYGPECKGHYVLNVSSKDKPVVIYADKTPLTDKRELWSGCYGRAVINFFVFDYKGNRGVSAALNGIMKLYDGEPLGAGVVTDADWDDDFEDDMEEGDLLF